MAILDELKSLNSREEIEAESGQLPIKTLETFDMMSREIEEKQDVRRSMVNQNNKALNQCFSKFWMLGSPFTLTAYKWNHLEPIGSIWFHLYTIELQTCKGHFCPF